TRKDPNVYLDATAMAEALFDDHMATNPILMGAAYQAGALPISAASIERAIRLNGVAVEMNLLAFRWGRMAVVDAKYVEGAVERVAGRESWRAISRGRWCGQSGCGGRAGGARGWPLPARTCGRWRGSEAGGSTSSSTRGSAGWRVRSATSTVS